MTLWRLRSIRTCIKKISFSTLLYIFCIGLFLLAELLLLLKEYVPPILILSLTVCSGLLSFAALVTDHRSDIALAWKSPVTKVAVAFISFWVSAYSLHFADDMIVQYTSLSPAKFPRAQTLMASVIAPILWVVVFSFVFVGLYVLQGFLMVRNFLLSSKCFMRCKLYRTLRIVSSLPIRPLQEPNTFLDVVKLIGIQIMTMVVIVGLLTIVSSSEINDRPFRQLFVVSSFYSNNGVCRSLPNDDEIFIFEDGKVLHVSDKISLSFGIVGCP